MPHTVWSVFWTHPGIFSWTIPNSISSLSQILLLGLDGAISYDLFTLRDDMIAGIYIKLKLTGCYAGNLLEDG